MKLKSLIYLMLLIFFNSTAAEFPWFKIGDSYQGFVEFIDGNQSTRNIYVLPVLGLPGTAYYQDNPWGFSAPSANTGIEIAENGDCVLNFKIHTNNDHLPADFKQKVIDHITGKGFDLAKYKNISAASYIINFIKPQNIKVILFIGNTKYDTKIYNGILDGNFKDNFLVSADNLNALRKGDFDVKIEYDFPYQNYSSLSVNIKEEVLTKVKIDVFRELIQQSSSSGGGFFIWKWKQKTHRVIEKNRVDFEESNSDANDITIVYRDPTPAMVERINIILGFYTTTKAQLLESHKAAYNIAMNQNNTDLGALHKKYIAAVQDDDVSKSIDVLKAATALTDSNLFSFLASGVAFSESSSSSYSSFHGIKKVNISSTSTTAYNELMSTTVSARFNSTGFKPINLKNAINDAYIQKNTILFNNPSFLPLYTKTWEEPFLDAALNNDLTTIKYLTTYFTPIAQVNTIGGPNRNSALHVAVQNNNLDMVKELIRFGVNPLLKNRYNETAKEIAIEKGFNDIASFLQQKENNLGTIQIEFSLPPGFQIAAIHYYPLELPFKTGLDNRSKVKIFRTNTITVKYYPGIYPVSLLLEYIDPYGIRKMADMSNIYRIKNTGILNYRENLRFDPSIQMLTNGIETYIGTMVDPIYLDN